MIRRALIAASIQVMLAQADGDNEINGVLGTKADFTPTVPEPSAVGLMLAGGVVCLRTLRKRAKGQARSIT